MKIEDELVTFLEKNIKEGLNKSRDIEIVKYYYGLQESPWPTLEETASRFNVGTRERVRQLLNSKFRNSVKTYDLPSLASLVEVLQTKESWQLSEFKNEVVFSGLISQETHMKGIFNLVEDVGVSHEYNIYTPDLKRATRSSIDSNRNSFLITNSDIKRLTKLLKKAQGLPGRCGIANLNYIKSDLGEDFDLISSLIESSPTSWVRIDGDEYWYIFENRDNTLINYSEKVFLVIESCESRRLSETYRNALDGRTYKYPYPPVDIVEAYLKSSVYFINTDTGMKFIGETSKLNEIQKDLISFFDANRNSSFTQLDQYLSNKGYGRPHILKNTNFSPLVFVDKNAGRRNYVYSLIGQSPSTQETKLELDRYELFLLRLRALLNTGTDVAREQVSRKEQHILQEWLFKEKTHENCAICGQEFSVKSLVAAHKKPRSDCNDAERLDPYVVMPLCLMGCDYLYENMYIYIDGDKIHRGLAFNDGKTELNIINNLQDRKVDPIWLLGNKSYFRSPNKALQRTSR